MNVVLTAGRADSPGPTCMRFSGSPQCSYSCAKSQGFAGSWRMTHSGGVCARSYMRFKGCIDLLTKGEIPLHFLFQSFIRSSKDFVLSLRLRMGFSGLRLMSSDMLRAPRPSATVLTD